ncbi:MAG: hypothetical protein V1899_09665 [Planctomycetota bacterium]
MTISYYIHAWQGLLMFLGGISSILMAFAGYLQSGGGEELLRRALANLETGNAQFANISLHWREGKLVVNGLRHADFQWPKYDPIARFSGLQAEEMSVTMDLLPWPPAIKGFTVRGMHHIAINVSESFLQSGLMQDLTGREIPTIKFEDCNLKLTIGDLEPLELSGCSGVLRRETDNQSTASPKEQRLRGSFSLSRLNDKPFDLKLESLEDGGWMLSGGEIQIDTAGTLRAKTNPFSGKFDPVRTLVGALFTGEMGATGTLASLRIAVQPASEKKKFNCYGEVGYRNLELRLPPSAKEAGQAVPFWLAQLIGSDVIKGDPPWPRWMQVDRIRTGDRGRVAFHMANGALNFACDEGLGSALTGIRQDRVFPPLEAFKGLVETDLEGRPKRIALRGFLGSELNLETRIDIEPDRSRTYELILQPRAGNARQIVFEKPLWRFVSRVRDYLAVQNRAAGTPLAEFELEGDARHFPIIAWLPPGIQDLSGHIYAKGSFDESLKLRFDKIRLDDSSSLIYGGADHQRLESLSSDFGPLWKTLQALFETDVPWKMQDLALQGEAEVQFSPDLRWQSTTLQNWSLTSGFIHHAGLTTDLGLFRIQLDGRHQQAIGPSFDSKIELRAFRPDLWELKLAGNWKTAPGKASGGVFALTEKDIPRELHPQRKTLGTEELSPDKRRVNQVITVRINEDGKAELKL